MQLLDQLTDVSIDRLSSIISEAKQSTELRKQITELAFKIRQEHYGDTVFMRGLIEFSNICKQDCYYCGIRASNRNAERYRLTPEEILSCCQEGYELGYRTFVLQSGEDFWLTGERMADLIRTIKAHYPDCAVTLSLGERSDEDYRLWREAGADRYLLRHETASEELYRSIHPPAMSYQNRMSSLKLLQTLGYQVGAGFMVGLPGQTDKHLAEDLMFLHQFQPHMIGIGPFIPHRDTPLANAASGTVEDTLLMVSLVRILVPKALLPATTALGTLDEQGREKALKAGANVVMPNLSPTSVKPKYALYENKICTGDIAAHCRHCLEMRIVHAGFSVSMTRGDHASMSC